jgi:hypothetical protein
MPKVEESPVLPEIMERKKMKEAWRALHEAGCSYRCPFPPPSQLGIVLD